MKHEPSIYIDGGSIMLNTLSIIFCAIGILFSFICIGTSIKKCRDYKIKYTEYLMRYQAESRFSRSCQDKIRSLERENRLLKTRFL